MTIRPIVQEDLPGILRILDLTTEFNRRDIECCIECLQDFLKGREPTYRFICAESEGRISGFACFDSDTLADSVFDIYWIVVSPQCRKNGVGRLLISHIESEAKRLGAKMIVIETESDPLYNGARRLYESCGYVQEACIRDFYRRGDDKITYVKRFSLRQSVS